MQKGVFTATEFNSTCIDCQRQAPQDRMLPWSGALSSVPRILQRCGALLLPRSGRGSGCLHRHHVAVGIQPETFTPVRRAQRQ